MITDRGHGFGQRVVRMGIDTGTRRRDHRDRASVWSKGGVRLF